MKAQIRILLLSTIPGAAASGKGQEEAKKLIASLGLSNKERPRKGQEVPKAKKRPGSARKRLGRGLETYCFARAFQYVVLYVFEGLGFRV